MEAKNDKSPKSLETKNTSATKEKSIKRAKEYMKAHGDFNVITDRAVLREILSDLMHFAEAEDIDFEEALSCARKYKEIDNSYLKK